MRYFFGTMLSFLLTSCDPNLLFMEPQPAGSRDLAKFPDRLHGTYLETVDDSSVFVVTSNYIFQQYKEVLNLPLGEILEDDEVTLKGDSLILKDMDLALPVLHRNDSVFGTVSVYDTIFDLSADHKLRKLGRQYFLNFPHDSMWIVLKLRFERDHRAYLFDINENEEAEIFEQYCQVEVIRNDKGKPEKYIMQPSRNEFRSLLKLGTFSDTTSFIRIKQ